MLTGMQQEIWEFIVGYVDRSGYPPTVREIGEAVGLASPSTVHAHLANLERAGYLRRDPTKPRALELTGHKKAAQHSAEPLVPLLPLLGDIAAGGPLLAEEHVEDYIAVPPPLSRGGDEFLLRVKGDSMINAGILDGDFVVIRRGDTATSGDIVVALIQGEEATLKRLRRKGASIALEAANPLYETRIFGPDQVAVQGKLVGLIRRYH